MNKRVLNVGGASKDIPLPAHYDGWDHILLDASPAPGVDIVMDARQLHSLPALTHKYDAVYCAHNLEHYYKHDALTVLRNFRHVLAPKGFVEVRVPDIQELVDRIKAQDLDIDDTLYISPSGPVTPHDIIYGYGPQVASGNAFYAHKCGFTQRSLAQLLVDAGFGWVQVGRVPEAIEIRALAKMHE